MAEDHLNGDVERDRAHLHVLRGQAVPRWRIVAYSWQPYAALALGVVAAVGVQFLPSRDVAINEFAGHGLTVSSISVSACLTGLVLSIALPGSERIANWAKMPGPTDGFSVLSDLVFTFFWAGCSQILAVLVSISALFFGADLSIGSPHPLRWTHWVALGSSFTIFAYALLQLLVVFQTLVQVGALIIAEEQRSG